jgi:hypothetical protein
MKNSYIFGAFLIAAIALGTSYYAGIISEFTAILLGFLSLAAMLHILKY